MSPDSNHPYLAWYGSSGQASMPVCLWWRLGNISGIQSGWKKFWIDWLMCLYVISSWSFQHRKRMMQCRKLLFERNWTFLLWRKTSAHVRSYWDGAGLGLKNHMLTAWTSEGKEDFSYYYKTTVTLKRRNGGSWLFLRGVEKICSGHTEDLKTKWILILWVILLISHWNLEAI